MGFSFEEVEEENKHRERMHRTLVQILLETGYKEVAALLLDGWLSEAPRFRRKDENSAPGLRGFYAFKIVLPRESYELIKESSGFQECVKKCAEYLLREYLNFKSDRVSVVYQPQLLELEENWRDKLKLLVLESREANQAVVSEKVLARRAKKPYLYNEMKFASKSEIAIAQVLEEKGILFFPLPLAVRSNTGALYLDHREPDFLICNDGVWGILEVLFHPNRFEKDAEKDVWFKQSGILCIQHYTAERCYQTPSEVVDEFLMVLAKHKRS